MPSNSQCCLSNFICTSVSNINNNSGVSYIIPGTPFYCIIVTALLLFFLADLIALSWTFDHRDCFTFGLFFSRTVCNWLLEVYAGLLEL